MDMEFETERRKEENERKKNRIRRAILVLMVLFVLINLGSCGARLAYRVSVPLRTAEGEEWNGDWITVGKKLGIREELLPDDWSPDYNETISTADKVYMALCGMGTPEVVDYEDNDGNPAQRNRYAAGWYLMVRGSGGEAAARADLEEWKAAQQAGCESWRAEPEITLAAGETEIALECFSYTYLEGISEDYSEGIIVFGSYQGWALCLQLDWAESTGWSREEGAERFSELLDTLVFAK